MSKNYIVTLAKPEVEEERNNLLQELSSKYKKSKAPKDAVDLLAGELSEIASDDVIELQSVGAYVLQLEEKDADELRKKSNVAEVVEDIEVFALNQDADPEQENLYMAGYHQAMADLYSGGQDNQMASSIDAQSPFLRRPLPPRLRLPRRPFPIPFPGRPPILLPPRQPIGWNIRLVKADRVWRRVTGAGVKVAILDTGIDTDHPDLTVAGGVSMVPGVASFDDDNSHGTHCAGTVAARNNFVGVVGVAPSARLYAVKVLNGAGSGQLSWILAGMDWAARNRMDVVSMSLGSNVNSPTLDYIVAYQRAAENLNRRGCIVIAAAGNNGRSATNPWVGNPARCPSIMAVAAVDRNCRIANFSSHGPAALPRNRGVEISAPGVSINSTIPGGGYGLKSGTSMACPHVAGAAALIKQLRPTWTPAQIRRRLISTARDLGAPSYDEYFGYGLLDCNRAIFGMRAASEVGDEQLAQSGYGQGFFEQDEEAFDEMEYAYNEQQPNGVSRGVGSLV